MEFQACFLQWMQAVAEVTAGEVIAIDGKALRRSFAKGTGKRAIHMVSAWASENGVVLGQRKVDTKSNEITAIPELLDRLALKGCIVTIDAMGCQRPIAQKIVEQEADYVLALKGNQPTLEQAVERFFVTGAEAEAHRTQSEYHEQTEQGHGRVETRCAWISADLEAEVSAAAWPGLQSIGMVEASRTVDGKTSVGNASISAASRPTRSNLPKPSANTGGLRTNCIGALMSLFVKIRVGCVPGMALRTLPCFATSPLISYVKSPARRVCPANASRARSILTTCLECY